MQRLQRCVTTKDGRISMGVISKKLEGWLERVTDNLPARLIDVEGEPYLERYFLFKVRNPFTKRQYAGYIHRFNRGDSMRAVHSHPWYWSISLILIGWYLEKRFKPTPKDGFIFGFINARKVRFLNFIFHNTFHRIILTPQMAPVWTLFIRSEETGRGWGFLVPTVTGPDGEILDFYYEPYPEVKKEERVLKKGYEIKRYRR